MVELVGCGRFFHTLAALPHGGAAQPREITEPQYCVLVRH
jgi:hypothetical protein